MGRQVSTQVLAFPQPSKASPRRHLLLPAVATSKEEVCSAFTSSLCRLLPSPLLLAPLFSALVCLSPAPSLPGRPFLLPVPLPSRCSLRRALSGLQTPMQQSEPCTASEGARVAGTLWGGPISGRLDPGWAAGRPERRFAAGSGSLILLQAGWRLLGPPGLLPAVPRGIPGWGGLRAHRPSPQPLDSLFFRGDTHGSASEVICFPQPRRALWQPGGQ